jgi:hypothetical protein
MNDDNAFVEQMFGPQQLSNEELKAERKRQKEAEEASNLIWATMRKKAKQEPAINKTYRRLVAKTQKKYETIANSRGGTV